MWLKLIVQQDQKYIKKGYKRIKNLNEVSIPDEDYPIRFRMCTIYDECCYFLSNKYSLRKQYEIYYIHKYLSDKRSKKLHGVIKEEIRIVIRKKLIRLNHFNISDSFITDTVTDFIYDPNLEF